MASLRLRCTVDVVEGLQICNILRLPQVMYLSVEEVRTRDYEAVKGSFQSARYSMDFLHQIQPITGTANYRVSKT